MATATGALARVRMHPFRCWTANLFGVGHGGGTPRLAARAPGQGAAGWRGPAMVQQVGMPGGSCERPRSSLSGLVGGRSSGAEQRMRVCSVYLAPVRPRD